MESRGTRGRTDFRFPSSCTSALLSHEESLKSEVKILRQGSVLQVFTCFLSCTWTTPSLSWPETSLPGVDSKQQRVSWGELGSTGVVSGMGTQGNCEEKLGGGGQFQTSALVTLLHDLSLLYGSALPVGGSPCQLPVWEHSW